LCAHASGVYSAEAAIGLLIGHERWLGRSDFVDQFVTMAGDDDAAIGVVTPMAAVDWPAAVAALDDGRLPCSSGEEQVLRIAASIGAGIAVDLGDALCGLDSANVALVAEAVLHAGGHPAVTRWDS